MQVTREMRIGAAALAFIGAVAWMLPPTTPVAPISGPGQYAVRPRPLVTAAAYPPVGDPPETLDGGSQAPPIPIDRAADPLPDPASPRWRDPSDAADDGRPDPDFMTGYDWAEAKAIGRRDDCGRWRGTAAEDGCRTFLSDTAERENDAEPELADQ